MHRQRKDKTNLPDTAVGVGTMADASVVLACSNVPKELVTLMGPE